MNSKEQEKTKMKAAKEIRKGDKVMAIAGNYKGQTGTVIQRFGDKVTVTGLNMKKKHIRKSQENPQGGIIDIERPIHISNLAVCSPTNKPVKLKKRINKKGEKELYYTDDGKEVLHRNMKKSS